MGHYEALLELNPNDNQGNRYPLLGCYLAHGRLDKADELLRDFKGDIMATFAWGRVLERFLAGDRPGAQKALKYARKGNSFAELLFSGYMQMSEDPPETYGLGSREEAEICYMHLAPAWAEHRDALFWLLDQLHSEAVSVQKKPGRKSRKPE